MYDESSQQNTTFKGGFQMKKVVMVFLVAGFLTSIIITGVSFNKLSGCQSRIYFSWPRVLSSFFSFPDANAADNILPVQSCPTTLTTMQARCNSLCEQRWGGGSDSALNNRYINVCKTGCTYYYNEIKACADNKITN